jgi:Kef-type K+ transport system membrane component KefB
MSRTTIAYVLVLTVAVLGISGILHLGGRLPPPGGIAQTETAATASPDGSVLESVRTQLGAHAEAPLSRLFLQFLVIITASRLAGIAFSRLGQPAVVGEMAAGILLGPSLFGWLAPEAFHFVFPATALETLKLLSQIGVCLFMFSVGMDLDVRLVRTRVQSAVMVSHVSIVFPYLLGVALAYFLYVPLAQPGATFPAFALFMGISMSITAFPVLARILQERGLSRTFLGSTAITCAAVDDVTAWSLLAFVVAIVRATDLAASALNLALVVGFILAMVGWVRPALQRWMGEERLRQDPTKGVLAAVVCVVLAAAWSTEVIGIHALFGAFLAGAIMPESGGFRHKLGMRIENFSSVLLLPLFFAYTGLRTQIGLLSDASDWLLCLIVLLVATLGKLGGSAVAARFTGMTWKDSLQLGALMNTRGLMELIALNLGYDLGILSPRIFAMLVIMALLTTTLTGPLLTMFERIQPVPEGGLNRSTSA